MARADPADRTGFGGCQWSPASGFEVARSRFTGGSPVVSGGHPMVVGGQPHRVGWEGPSPLHL